MIGGLVVSTVLTLVIVPLFYTLIDDLREHAAKIMRTIFTARASVPSAPPVSGQRAVTETPLH